MKVKFFEKHVVVRPGAGETVYKGTMDINENLAKRWEKVGYLEIVKPKPKRTYKKKVDVEKNVEKVEQDG